jgi:hypothetical protein
LVRPKRDFCFYTFYLLTPMVTETDITRARERIRSGNGIIATVVRMHADARVLAEAVRTGDHTQVEARGLRFVHPPVYFNFQTKSF